jgi:hypothetical protein
MKYNIREILILENKGCEEKSCQSRLMHSTKKKMAGVTEENR